MQVNWQTKLYCGNSLVSRQAGLLHSIHCVPQELMSIFLTSKSEMFSNPWGQEQKTSGPWYIYIYNWIILNHSLSLNSSKKTLWLCCLFLYKHQGLTLKGWYDTKVSKPKINFITLSKLRLCHAPLKWLIQTCPHMSTSRCGNICVMPAKCSRKEGVVSVTAVVLKQQGRSSAFLGESKITLFGFPKVDAFRNH